MSSKSCLHTDLMVHVFIELQVPYYLKHGDIDYITIDDTPRIRPDMGATCEQCEAFDVSFEDWRTAPEGLRTLFTKVRQNMVEKHGYIEGYPLENEEPSS